MEDTRLVVEEMLALCLQRIAVEEKAMDTELGETDWSRNSSCQQHWVLRSTCELFQDQEIQINSCAAAGRKWSEPFYSEGCNDGYQVFFSILDFFSRCVTTWYCQSKVSVMIQTQAVSESLWVKRAIVELLRAENVTVYFVFVRLNKASTSEFFLVSDASVKRYNIMGH